LTHLEFPRPHTQGRTINTCTDIRSALTQARDERAIAHAIAEEVVDAGQLLGVDRLPVDRDGLGFSFLAKRGEDVHFIKLYASEREVSQLHERRRGRLVVGDWWFVIGHLGIWADMVTPGLRIQPQITRIRADS